MGDLAAVSDTPTYDERLSVPLRWWVQGVMFLATVWIAVILWVPAGLAWSITGVLVVLFALMMLTYGGARITVSGSRLVAGRAQIDARYLGAVESLSADEAWQVAGPKADARAYLLLRPYLRRAVRVEIVDDADPAPYWLLNTRYPDRLAAAIAAMTASATTGD
jgi:energy-coupling factor transporter transmembrane protein EcfT